MIVVELYEGQGLGNQLWVYAAGRSIAERLGVSFLLIGLERFKGKDFIDLEPFVSISNEKANEIKKNHIWETFHERRYYDDELKYISSGFDERVLSLQGSYKLEGLFQSEQYFFGDLDKPKRYFVVKKSVRDSHNVSNSTCVINLRGGEYKRHKDFILPLSYWNNAVKNMKSIHNIENFLVVTDDIPYAKLMFPEYEVLYGGICECYATLHNAKFLILSNSTFSYFPIKTGNNAKFVIAPLYFARFGNKFNRWASVANLYQGWNWQDVDGNLITYKDCIAEQTKIQTYYENNYYLCLRKIPKPKLKLSVFVPRYVKTLIKYILSYLNPKYF